MSTAAAAVERVGATPPTQLTTRPPPVHATVRLPDPSWTNRSKTFVGPSGFVNVSVTGAALSVTVCLLPAFQLIVAAPADGVFDTSDANTISLLTVTLPADVASVMIELLLIPNVNPFEFENTTVPEVPVCVPAAAAMPPPAPGVTDAVTVLPLRPNETPLLLLKTNADRLLLVVPALRFTAVRLVAIDAVTVDALSPKLTLLAFENVKALAKFDVVPADTLIDACVLATVTLAVTTDELLIPNVTLLLFENTTVPLVAVCVPAAATTPAPEGDIDAVTVDPFMPNETPLEFENTRADRLLLVVPAETFTAVRLVATEAVRVDAFNPNDTPFELENVTAETRLLVVPALTLKLPCVDATVALAVSVEPFRPKETLFALDRTMFERFPLVVPADTLTLVSTVPPFGSDSVAFPVGAATTASIPAEFDIPIVTVDAVFVPTWNAAPLCESVSPLSAT
jgi:hypothetical protein